MDSWPDEAQDSYKKYSPDISDTFLTRRAFSMGSFISPNDFWGVCKYVLPLVRIRKQKAFALGKLPFELSLDAQCRSGKRRHSSRHSKREMNGFLVGLRIGTSTVLLLSGLIFRHKMCKSRHVQAWRRFGLNYAADNPQTTIRNK